jgi:hypothetical protein
MMKRNAWLLSFPGLGRLALWGRRIRGSACECDSRSSLRLVILLNLDNAAATQSCRLEDARFQEMPKQTEELDSRDHTKHSDIHTLTSPVARRVTTVSVPRHRVNTAKASEVDFRSPTLPLVLDQLDLTKLRTIPWLDLRNKM